MENKSSWREFNSTFSRIVSKGFEKSFFFSRQSVIFALLVGVTLLTLGIFAYLIFENARSGELRFTTSDAIEQLELNFPMGNILLIPWEKDYIILSFEFFNRSSSRKEIIVEERGKVWELRWDRSFSPSDWKGLDLPIFHLRFPENKVRSLKFRVKCGLVEIGSFTDWMLSGFLVSGRILVHNQIGSTGDLQVGWGSIKTMSPLKNKIWEKSTGFRAVLETGRDRALILRTYMGALRTEVKEDKSV